MLQDEFQEHPLLGIERGLNLHRRASGTRFPCHRRLGIRDVREHVEQIAVLGVDDRLHFGQLLVTETLFGERSEEHTSELQSLMRISYAVFCLKKTTHVTSDDNNI